MDMCDSATNSMLDMQSSDCSPNTSNSSASSPADSELDTTQETGTSPQHRAKIESVYVPDLFSSIMAVKPIVNPNYHEVKPKADSWIKWYAYIDCLSRWTQRSRSEVNDDYI